MGSEMCIRDRYYPCVLAVDAAEIETGQATCMKVNLDSTPYNSTARKEQPSIQIEEIVE